MKRAIIGGLLAAAIATVAFAQGIYTPGMPNISSPSGSEQIPMDTLLSGGRAPQSGYMTLDAIAQYSRGGAAFTMVRGETALDGSNPTPVATGLSSIAACTVSIKSTATPGVSTSVVTYGTSSGTLNLYGWTVTNSSTTTMIASTGTDTIGWICFGTE